MIYCQTCVFAKRAPDGSFVDTTYCNAKVAIRHTPTMPELIYGIPIRQNADNNCAFWRWDGTTVIEEIKLTLKRNVITTKT